MTSSKSVKYSPPTEIDPNFFLPPNVVDMRYVNVEENEDSTMARDDDSGEIVNVDYQDTSYSELEDSEDSGPVSAVISPPNYAEVVSQTVRVTEDGKFVVDVVLDIEDVPGAVNYNVKVNKV